MNFSADKAMRIYAIVDDYFVIRQVGGSKRSRNGSKGDKQIVVTGCQEWEEFGMEDRNDVVAEIETSTGQRWSLRRDLR